MHLPRRISSQRRWNILGETISPLHSSLPINHCDPVTKRRAINLLERTLKTFPQHKTSGSYLGKFVRAWGSGYRMRTNQFFRVRHRGHAERPSVPRDSFVIVISWNSHNYCALLELSPPTLAWMNGSNVMQFCLEHNKAYNFERKTNCASLGRLRSFLGCSLHILRGDIPDKKKEKKQPTWSPRVWTRLCV